jgi:hypothetical protein
MLSVAMTHRARITIATLATTLFLGAISAAGVAIHSSKPPPAPISAVAPIGQAVPAPTWQESND